MQARDVMTRQVVTISPDTPVFEIAKRLIERRISAVPVVEADGRIVGIVSEGDLMRRPETGTERQPAWWLRLLALPEERARDFVQSHGIHARDVMTRDLVTVAEDAPLEDVARLLEKHRIKRVPVVQAGKLAGIVSRANLIQSLATRRRSHRPPVIDRKLREEVQDAITASGVRNELVTVVVSEGVVHLWGATYSDAERDAIRISAEGVPGVKRVRDDMSVLPQNIQTGMWE